MTPDVDEQGGSLVRAQRQDGVSRRPTAVEWLLVDTPDSVTTHGTRTALLHVPHIAIIRSTQQGLTVFLRNNHMVTTLVDPLTLTRLDALTAQGLWDTLMAAPITHAWYAVGKLLVNCAELIWIEFDVPRAAGALPARARVTTTYHGETSSMATEEDAHAWWAFATARGTTMAQIVADHGVPREAHGPTSFTS